MNLRTYLVLALVAIISSACLAQSPTRHVSISAEIPPGRHTGVVDLERIIARLDGGKLGSVTPGSWEDQVLTGGKKSASLNLQLNLADPNKASIYTLPTDEGDVLVAFWNGADAGRKETAIWLWDTPSYTTFVMEVNPAILEPAEFVRYCEGLFRWDKDPFHLKALKLTYLDSQRGKERLIGLGDHIKTERGSFNMWFAAVTNEGTAYVGIGMSKFALSEYPPEAVMVPERFPPLRVRLKNVPRQALFEEIGKGYVAPQLLTYPRNRDAIVLAELLSRGPLSDAEVRETIFGSFDKGDVESANVVISRVGAFLHATEEGEKLPSYASALERLFLDVPIHPAFQGAVIGHVFAAMKNHHVDFSHAALAFLERDRFGSESLFYLERHVRDEQTLRKLTEIKVTPELEQRKKDVLQRIKESMTRELEPR